MVYLIKIRRKTTTTTGVLFLNNRNINFVLSLHPKFIRMLMIITLNYHSIRWEHFAILSDVVCHVLLLIYIKTVQCRVSFNMSCSVYLSEKDLSYICDDLIKYCHSLFLMTLDHTHTHTTNTVYLYKTHWQSKLTI